MENKESFVELYTRLYNENFDELEGLREKEKKKSIIFIILLIVIFVTFPIFFPLAIVLFVVLIIISIKNTLKKVKVSSSIIETRIVNGVVVEHKVAENKKSYKETFKEKIITPIINYVFPDAKYTPFSGIRETEYMMGNWESYDRYSSEDKIITDINLNENKDINLEFTIAEVHTENRHEDDEGHVSYTTVFHGLAGSINLPKDIGCYLKVIKNTLSLFGSSKDKLQMDMSEFEKIFDVKTDDRIKAMQILTSDIMSELIELLNTSKVKFEFYINHDIMHIRFHTGEMFEPAVFGKSMQLEKLRKYFDIVSAVKTVTEHICNTIQNLEI